MDNLRAVESIFRAALAKPLEERSAYLAEACANDPEMRQRVERLLAAQPEGSSLLQAGASLAITRDVPLGEGPGKRIGPYKLLQQIGAGGMGVVYMAEQDSPVRLRVALKIIKPGKDNAEVIARFEAERQTLVLMDHQNIARVLDAGATESGLPYFVMELVHGVTITKYCDDNKLTPRERLQLFVPVCLAVQHVHQQGIIHRDLKPSNILVTVYDGKPVPKVIDFGLAKATEQRMTERRLFTEYSTIVGTFEYMAPEHADMSTLGVDTRSDVYSLGVLLYELLTGTTPLQQSQLREVALDETLRLIREQDPPPPSTRIRTSGQALATIARKRNTEPAKLAKLLRGELDWIVMRALEKDRTRRYETAGGLARDVEHYLVDEPVEACPPSATYRLRKFVRKHRARLAAAAVFALLLITGPLVISWQASQATHAEENAHHQAIEAQSDRDEATTANSHLREVQETLRETLYFARSNLLQNAWDTNNTRRVLELLDQQRPGPGERDLRGFEWYYRHRQCHLDLLSLSGLGGNRWPPIFPAFSPDGRSVVALAKQTTERFQPSIAIYDLNTGNERARLELETKYNPDQLGWSPDSKRILVHVHFNGRLPRNSGEPPTKFVAYDALTGKEAYVLKQPNSQSHEPEIIGPMIFEAIFSPDGKYLAECWSDYGQLLPSLVVLADAETGKPLRTFRGASGKLAFSSDGNRLAALVVEKGKDNAVKCWNTTTGVELFSTKPLLGLVSHLAFTPDGLTGFIRRAARTDGFLIDGFISAEYDTEQTWDATNGMELFTRNYAAQDPQEYASFVGFSPDNLHRGTLIYRPSGPVTISIRDRMGGVHNWRDLEGTNLLEFSPDGKRVATAGSDTLVRIWNLGDKKSDASKAPALVLRGHVGVIVSLRFHPDGKRLFTACSEGGVKVWNLTPGDSPVTVESGTGENSLFVSSATAGRLVTVNPVKDSNGLERNQITIWDYRGKPMGSCFTGPVCGDDRNSPFNHIALSPDGKRLAIVVFQGKQQQLQGSELRVIETDTGKEIYTRKEGRACQCLDQGLAFSPNGTLLAWGFTDQTAGPSQPMRAEVKVMQVSDGVELRSIGFPDAAFTDLTFSPDNTRLVTSTASSSSAVVKVWDIQTGEERSRFDPVNEQRAIRGLVYSPDGKRFAAILDNIGIGEDPKVLVWDGQSGRKLLTLRGQSGQFTNLAFTPDGKRLASAMQIKRGSFPSAETGREDEITIWDAATGNDLMTLRNLGGNDARHLMFSPDGLRLYAVDQIGPRAEGRIEIRTWNASPLPDK